ncbi:hypothetical protein TREES_T100011703 [Tupaia chinensis]|uniref:Uncharacterized protein n=1 Tax=Tupaia chinensis TaxID=246437 RepID=L9L1W0_TUPCH|nr:hypothetical protein TREES_T100011703 [Tupaia chinensis]
MCSLKGGGLSWLGLGTALSGSSIFLVEYKKAKVATRDRDQEAEKASPPDSEDSQDTDGLTSRRGTEPGEKIKPPKEEEAEDELYARLGSRISRKVGAPAYLPTTQQLEHVTRTIQRPASWGRAHLEQIRTLSLIAPGKISISSLCNRRFWAFREGEVPTSKKLKPMLPRDGVKPRATRHYTATQLAGLFCFTSQVDTPWEQAFCFLLFNATSGSAHTRALSREERKSPPALSRIRKENISHVVAGPERAGAMERDPSSPKSQEKVVATGTKA